MYNVCRKSRVVLAILTGIVIFAIIIRWLPFRACFAAERTYFVATDSYYHLRRVLQVVNDFWRIPPIDYYVGYPQGTPNMLAPFMYLLMGGVSLLAAVGGHPDVKLVEALCAAAPTIWGALCAIPIFFITRQLFGTLAGLVAAFSFEVIPECIAQTVVGNFDNNGFEPLLAAFFLLALACALPENVQGHAEGANGGTKWVTAGLAGWLALFTWRGSIVFFVIAIAYSLLEFVVSCFRRRSPALVLCTIGSALMTVGILSLPFVVLSIWGALPVFKFNVISWVHVLACCGSGAVLLFASRIEEKWFHSSNARLVGISLVIVPLAGFITFLLVPAGSGADMSLRNYLFTQDNPWDVQELYGLFYADQGLSFKQPGQLLSLAVWVFPLVWFCIAKEQVLNKLIRPRLTFFLVWSLIFMVLAIGRVRFAMLAAMGVAILLGALASRIAAPSKKGWAVARGIVAASLVIVLLIPAWQKIILLPTGNYLLPDTKDLFAALDWMRISTPATSHFDHPWRKPEYGVLARWEFGHWINYIARRPAVATPMLTETYGILPQARFFLAENDEEADRILTENGVRFVIISNTLRALPSYARMAGYPSDTYFVEEKDASGNVVDMARPGWLRLLSTRLLLNDGLPLVGTKKEMTSPSHLCLVYESAGKLDLQVSGDVARIKVFERVRGANLSGSTRPSSKVSANIRLLSNQGRVFMWQHTTLSGPDGRFSIIIPYSTETNGAIKALSPCHISMADGERIVSIGRNAVEEGTDLSL